MQVQCEFGLMFLLQKITCSIYEPWVAESTLTLPSSIEVTVMPTYMTLAPMFVFNSLGIATEPVCTSIDCFSVCFSWRNFTSWGKRMSVLCMNMKNKTDGTHANVWGSQRTRACIKGPIHDQSCCAKLYISLPIHDQVNQHHTRSIMLHNTQCCATWLIVYGPLIEFTWLTVSWCCSWYAKKIWIMNRGLWMLIKRTALSHRCNKTNKPEEYHLLGYDAV
jgi:hypothetical protein